MYQEFIGQYPKIAREYLEKYWKGDSRIDNTYGLNYDDTTESWNLGSKPLYFIENGDIEIENTAYKGTQGLYNFFLKDPKCHLDSEKEMFRKILEQTNLHRKNHDPAEHMVGNRGSKYTQIIQPLASGSASSQASELKRNGSAKTEISILTRLRAAAKIYFITTYTTFENGKSLVGIQRKTQSFKNLEASKQVGNNNNMNEIILFLKEMERLGVIEFY